MDGLAWFDRCWPFPCDLEIGELSGAISGELLGLRGVGWWEGAVFFQQNE